MKLESRHLIIVLLTFSYQIQWYQLHVIFMLIYSLLILGEDFAGFKVIRINISTAYAVLLTLTSISHIIVLFGLDNNPYYFAKYYSTDLAGKAIMIFNIGSVFILETMRYWIRRKPEVIQRRIIFDGYSFWSVFIISILVFISSIYFDNELYLIGSIGSFYLWIINGSVFFLSYLANYKNRHIIVIFLYTFFLSVWSLQNSYLRMEMVIPWVAYLAGDILARKSIFKIHAYSKAAILIGIIILPPIFAFLAENRDKIRGRERLNVSLAEITDERYEKSQTIFSRMSIVPQLSNVIKLTERNGFYNGKTLEYYGFVFIPRFLWPSKPKIMQGQWFALEIGNARVLKSGLASNSINMTVPGEFYLNFGWTGLILGCCLFGIFVGWLWSQTSYQTFYGWMFRFYLLFLGLFSLGADLQIVPSVIASWLIYKAITYLTASKTQGKRRKISTAIHMS